MYIITPLALTLLFEISDTLMLIATYCASLLQKGCEGGSVAEGPGEWHVI